MRKRILNLIFITTVLFINVNAQVALQKQTDKNGTITSVRFDTDTNAESVSKSKEVLNYLNKMSAGDEWQHHKPVTDKEGIKHQYFNQYYKGIRVAYGVYSMHGNNEDKLELAIGTFQDVKDVDIIPKLTEMDALNFALKHIGADEYKWQVTGEERWISENFNKSYYPKGELLIVKDVFQNSNIFRLAYKFDIYAHNPVSRFYVYIDAINGNILDKDSRIFHTNANGMAQTRYSGTRNITSDSFSGGFRLRELRNNIRIETYNMNNTDTYSQTDFVDNDNNWIEHNNENRDDAALDAHWGTEIVYDYFNQVHARSSFDNGGSPLLSYVNANLIEMGYENNDNAFWDGNRMTFGRGTSLNPLTSLDICSHEIAHGMTESTARLAYRKESGAINEALSDIWAACIEAWVAPEKQRWMLGEDLGVPIRSMNNPNLFGQPDTYLGTNWFNINSCIPHPRNNDYCGVHTNSGVINYWFFLLSEGDTGTNDIGNRYWVNGIGINDAAKIVYRTQNVILNSNVEQEINFVQFREATITAAINIFGSNSNEVVQVTNAWHAVGVGDRYNYSISGPSTICSQATYTINNLPEGATVQWNVSRNLSIVTGQGTDSVLVQKRMDGIGIISAVVSINGQDIPLPQKTIQAGTDFPVFALYDAASNMQVQVGTVGSNHYFQATGSNLPAYPADFYWTVVSPNPDEIPMNFSGRQFSYCTNEEGYYSISLKINGECGWSAENTQSIYFQDTNNGFVLSPNPASSTVTVEVAEETPLNNSAVRMSTDTKTGSINYTIQLWNSSGLVKQVETDQPSYQLDLTGVPPGFYYVHVIKDGQTYRRQLVVQ